MSFHQPTRRQLATHEAGHAYAFAALLGHDHPVWMGLGVDEKGGHHGWSTRRTLLHREVPFRDLSADCRPSVEWQADVEIAVAIAGPLSEFRHRHRSRWAALTTAVENVAVFLLPDAFDTDGDFARIRASLVHVEEPRPAARLKELIFVADEVLVSNWPRVRGLARLLLDRGELGEAELTEWFGLHSACHHQHAKRAPTPD